MKGFTFPFGRKDIFLVTERENKTQKLASETIRKLINYGYDIPDNPTTRGEILRFLQKATCEIHTLTNGKQYWEISGDGFGGRGSFIDDGNTIIIHLNKQGKEGKVK